MIWGRRFAWRVDVIVSPDSEVERLHATIIVRARTRIEAAAKAVRLALADRPNKIWRHLTVDVMPDIQ